MHVLSPKEIENRNIKKTRKNKRAPFVVLFLLIALGSLGWYGYKTILPTQKVATAPQDKTTEKQDVAPAPAATPKTKLKTFTGVQFRDLYRSTTYPNTESFTTPPEITGNTEADARIRSLAEKRGFVLTSIPVAPIEKSGELLTGEYQDDLLQPLAAKSWQQLKAAAKKDGLAMSLISGYRSPKSQRNLFTERLYATGVTAKQIAAGTADNTLNATLGMTAVPGFSRHHTGYTIDIYCDDGVAFGASKCNAWIIKNNYENAKKYGFIPSYPPGAGEQGPEPEAWEYVWVGTEPLYE